jgi:CubicO group peptidase (beta-lactamase class C family)
MRTHVLFSGIVAIILASTFLTGCSKDIFYIHGTVQEEMNKAVENGFDGIIVYVNKAGKSSFYSAGFNNRENQIPADPHSLFKIASISKLYIAAAATKLVADNKLALSAKLSDLLPEVEDRIDYADEITLELMLQHRSGIRDWSFEPEIEGETFDDYMSFMARIYDKEAKFKPDKKYGYSNSNYLLIAEIIDRTLGYSHQNHIQAEILEPLGLINTYKDYKDSDTSRVMSGYVIGWDADLRAWDFPLPGGNMVATAEDVGTFLRALIDGTLFTEHEQAIYSSVYEYEHTGWLPGYCSIARYHSDIDAIIIQFVNTSGKEIFWLKLKRVYNKIVHCVENENF